MTTIKVGYLPLVLLALPMMGWAGEQKTLQHAAMWVGAGASVDVSTVADIRLDVDIAGTATVLFEGTYDQSRWVSILCVNEKDLPDKPVFLTSTTVSGTFKCGVAGYVYLRSSISSWSGGAVTVRVLDACLATMEAAMKAMDEFIGYNLSPQPDTPEKALRRAKAVDLWNQAKRCGK